MPPFIQGQDRLAGPDVPLDLGIVDTFAPVAVPPAGQHLARLVGSGVNATPMSITTSPCGREQQISTFRVLWYWSPASIATDTFVQWISSAASAVIQLRIAERRFTFRAGRIML